MTRLAGQRTSENPLVSASLALMRYQVQVAKPSAYAGVRDLNTGHPQTCTLYQLIHLPMSKIKILKLHILIYAHV